MAELEKEYLEETALFPHYENKTKCIRRYINLLQYK